MTALGQLKAGNGIYEQLLGNLPDIILVLDEDDVIRYANKLAQKTVRIANDHLVGEYFGMPVIYGESSVVEIMGRQGMLIAEMHASKLDIQGQQLKLISLRDITRAERLREQFDDMMMATITTLSRTLEVRDPYTAGHEVRVARLSMEIGRRMGFDQDKLEGLNISGILHDIGKIAIPTSILTRPGHILDEEFNLVKVHSQVGHDLLKNIAFPWSVAEVALQHHERLDGSGYPYGLTGDEILPEAQIIAVADTVEAMMNNRPYRKGLGRDATFDFVRNSAGKTLNADACGACMELFEKDGFEFEDYG